MITHFLVPIQNFILIELQSRFIEHFLLYLNKETFSMVFFSIQAFLLQVHIMLTMQIKAIYWMKDKYTNLLLSYYFVCVCASKLDIKGFIGF